MAKLTKTAIVPNGTSLYCSNRNVWSSVTMSLQEGHVLCTMVFGGAPQRNERVGVVIGKASRALSLQGCRVKRQLLK